MISWNWTEVFRMWFSQMIGKCVRVLVKELDTSRFCCDENCVYSYHKSGLCDVYLISNWEMLCQTHGSV